MSSTNLTAVSKESQLSPDDEDYEIRSDFIETLLRSPEIYSDEENRFIESTKPRSEWFGTSLGKTDFSKPVDLFWKMIDYDLSFPKYVMFEEGENNITTLGV